MSSNRQQTIRKAVTVAGVGLHTGQQVEMTFRPAPVNHGFKFKRVDLDGTLLLMQMQTSWWTPPGERPSQRIMSG